MTNETISNGLFSTLFNSCTSFLNETTSILSKSTELSSFEYVKGLSNKTIKHKHKKEDLDILQDRYGTYTTHFVQNEHQLTSTIEHCE